MERPHRHTPKREDPNFVNPLLNKRSSNQPQRRLSGARRLSTESSSSKVNVGRGLNRRSSTRLSTDKPISDADSKAQVKTETVSSVKQKEETINVSKNLRASGICKSNTSHRSSRRLSQTGLVNPAKECEEDNKVKTHVSAAPSSKDAKDIRDDSAKAVCEKQDAVAMETTENDDYDDGEVSLNFSKTSVVCDESFSPTTNKAGTEASTNVVQRPTSSKKSIKVKDASVSGLATGKFSYTSIKPKLPKDDSDSNAGEDRKVGFNEECGVRGRWNCERKSERKSRLSSAEDLAKPLPRTLVNCSEINMNMMNPVIKIHQLDLVEYRRLSGTKRDGAVSPLKSLANEKAKLDGSKVKIMLERCDGFIGVPKGNEKVEVTGEKNEGRLGDKKEESQPQIHRQKSGGTPNKRRKCRDVFSSYLKKKYRVRRQELPKTDRGVKSVPKKKKMLEGGKNDKLPVRVSTRKKRRSNAFVEYMSKKKVQKKISAVVRKKSRAMTSRLAEDNASISSQELLSGDYLLKKIKEEVDDQGLYGELESSWSDCGDGLCDDFVAAADETVATATTCHLGEIGQITLAPRSSIPYGADVNFAQQSYEEFLNESLLCGQVSGVSDEINGQIGTISLALQSDDVPFHQDENVMEVSYEEFVSQDVTDVKGNHVKLKESSPPKRGRKKGVKIANKRSPPGGMKRKRDDTPSGVNKRRRCSLSGRSQAGARTFTPIGKKLLKNARQVKKTAEMEGRKARSGRGCRRQDCPRDTLKCVAALSEGCHGSDSVRWYHLSPGEHYCNSCFEYVYRADRRSGIGHRQYLEWQAKWAKNSELIGNIRMYMLDQIIPYWAQCSKCQKWREVPRDVNVTANFNKNFTCHQVFTGKAGVDPCSQREDPRVKYVKEEDWFSASPGILILTESAAAPFLVNYPPDDVGLSPFKYRRPKGVAGNKENQLKNPDELDNSDVDSDFDEELQDPNVEGVSDFLRPFHIPGGVLRAGTTEADKMNEDEEAAFPHHKSNPKSQKIYITLRNLILSLWNLNVKEWLTKDTCKHHIICRGLMKIYCVGRLEEILSYLTVKGLINFGLVKPPQQLRVISAAAKKEHVLVIGAGPAGLSVAHQLHRFGIQVTVLEAQSRIGGRVWDENFAGTVIGRGAQLLNGCLNNPFAVMSQQLNIETRDMRENCLLITESGAVIPPAVDNKIDYHFDQMLENVAEWRKGLDLSKDVSLLEKLEEQHKDFVAETGMSFTEEEESVIQFHFSNLEYALGQDLGQISALNWDHNEAFSQFCGPHVIMEQGYSSILKQLAEKLDIKLNTCVTEVHYSDSKVKVIDKEGHEFQGSKAVVTVPLKVLQNNSIVFDPPLPDFKQEAIEFIGAGAVEKVAIAFPSRFWDKKVQNADYFGHVPISSEERGLFSVFYDLTSKSSANGESVLVTFISGKAVDLVKKKTDAAVVKMCCEKLQKMFPEEEVPQPTKSFVTHWVRDPHAGMAFSYLGVGTTADFYDDLSEEIDSALFFAGEATNRQFPQSVTGAYLSGIREAEKILYSLGS